MHDNTITVTQPGNNDVAYQHVQADYTGIYALCGTVFIISIIALIIFNKISDKWRLDHHKIEQMKVTKSCEQNLILLRKLDKVLDVLNKEVDNNGTCG